MSLLEAFFWAIVVMLGIMLLPFIIKSGGSGDCGGDDDWGDFGGDG